MLQLLREISHENVVKLVNVHINHADMSLYLAFDYAEHDLYVSKAVKLPFHESAFTLRAFEIFVLSFFWDTETILGTRGTCFAFECVHVSSWLL